LGCEKVNVIFNQPRFLFEKSVEDALDKYFAKGEKRIFFTFSVDHNNVFSSQRLKYLRKKCDLLLGIKFHSVLQNITDDQFPHVLQIAEAASQHNMFVIVDGSYGAKSIHEVDHLKLADFLCQNIATPVVFAHSGCLKVKEAMLISLERPNMNLYFDTSFILSFWRGSSVEQDLAFVIKKLGVEKFFFGSDYPYLDFRTEFDLQSNFLEKNQIPQDAIFRTSAENFLSALSM
jgi:predicted TIM-barrel fold metal-dependent hydrolase